MRHMIRKCSKCYLYTLGPICKKCGAPTIDPHPARYSPDDRYARYRIADRYVDMNLVVEPKENPIAKEE